MSSRRKKQSEWIEAHAEFPEQLHLRPLQRVVETAQRFKSETVLHHGVDSANPKSILDMIELAARLTGAANKKLTVRARGEDAPAAIKAMVEAISGGS